MAAPSRIEHVGALDVEQAAAVRALVDRVTDHDGARPVSEHVWLHLRAGGSDHDAHVLATRGADVIGYAHVDRSDPVDGPSVELAVDPGERRLGLGSALLGSVLDGIDAGPVRLWAHGEAGGAAELATSFGFTQARVLWQMRRSLHAPLPRPEVPDGIEVRPFRVGVDEDAWLSVNARAFAQLPDQGGWTRADLEHRIGEPWFSAAGFLTAWRGARLVGFHWTKVHGSPPTEREPSTHAHAPIGEVYVVGVDPDERGTGLGRALTLLGLHHLRALGLTEAMLYVDASNAAAIALYTSLGFARWDTDTQFRRDWQSRYGTIGT